MDGNNINNNNLNSQSNPYIQDNNQLAGYYPQQGQVSQVPGNIAYNQPYNNYVQPVNPQNQINNNQTVGSASPEMASIVTPESINKPEMAENLGSNPEFGKQENKNEEKQIVKAVNQSPQPVRHLTTQDTPSEDGLSILGVKLFGYKVSTQLANMKKRFISMRGGNPAKARTWLVMLLDRLLKKEENL